MTPREYSNTVHSILLARKAAHLFTSPTNCLRQCITVLENKQEETGIPQSGKQILPVFLPGVRRASRKAALSDCFAVPAQGIAEQAVSVAVEQDLPQAVDLESGLGGPLRIEFDQLEPV